MFYSNISHYFHAVKTSFSFEKFQSKHFPRGIINAACQRLKIEPERAVVVLDRFGNTSSASIPLAVDDARNNKRLKPGDLVLMTGFGAGMTWASAIVRWPE